MALKVVYELSYNTLLLTVKVKRSNTSNHHFVEVFINDRFIAEHVGETIEWAVQQAKCSLDHWKGRLAPVFDAGRMTRTYA